MGKKNQRQIGKGIRKIKIVEESNGGGLELKPPCGFVVFYLGVYEFDFAPRLLPIKKYEE